MSLPWTVLALLYIAIYARLTRNNLLEVLGEDYIRTARAKGLSERRVILKHGLRASVTPIVTIFGLDIALLVGGAIITETVFNIQGLGWLAYDSTYNQDLPTLVGVVVLHCDGGRDREPDRRHPVRVPRPAHPLRIGWTLAGPGGDCPPRPRRISNGVADRVALRALGEPALLGFRPPFVDDRLSRRPRTTPKIPVFSRSCRRRRS
jgi:hypothetical protein